MNIVEKTTTIDAKKTNLNQSRKVFSFIIIFVINEKKILPFVIIFLINGRKLFIQMAWSSLEDLIFCLFPYQIVCFFLIKVP